MSLLPQHLDKVACLACLPCWHLLPSAAHSHPATTRHARPLESTQRRPPSSARRLDPAPTTTTTTHWLDCAAPAAVCCCTPLPTARLLLPARPRGPVVRQGGSNGDNGLERVSCATSARRWPCSPLTRRPECQCPPTTATTWRMVAGTMASGEASTCTRAMRYALCPAQCHAGPPAVTELTQHTARKGPHGHLPQAVCRGTAGPAAPGAHAALVAAPHPRRRLWDGHLGNRHGRVSRVPQSPTALPKANLRVANISMPRCAPTAAAAALPPANMTLQVLGLDLVNIQPEKIPPNLRFRVPRDYESPWLLGEDSWDLIHLRMACGSVTSWPELYQKIFTHLKPGTGYVEHVEIDMEPRCDDGSLPEDGMLKRWYGWLADATHRVARPIAYEHRTRQLLQQAGFIDIQETVIRVPYNSWPNDPHQKDIGRWYNLGITEGLEALTFAPLTRVYQWDLNTVVRPILDGVRREICNRKFHAYNNVHIWTARRPQQ
ncbi:Secondary metabolism regulator lae1, variant 3 [Plenodomus lindquistii]|nr:Secondary metabolism regulator lae1, variant 3 [Plenodomus lindquistii]